MSKQQYKNLSHAFRWMRQYVTEREAFAWIGHINLTDRRMLERIYT